jgi:hypothetical protein
MAIISMAMEKVGFLKTSKNWNLILSTSHTFKTSKTSYLPFFSESHKINIASCLSRGKEGILPQGIREMYGWMCRDLLFSGKTVIQPECIK